MSALYADSRLWNASHIFQDRTEAGRALGEFMASRYEGQEQTIVLAIPAGGVPVGLALSQRLKLPFDCLIVRKIQIPGNTEAGFGAMKDQGARSVVVAVPTAPLRSVRMVEERVDAVYSLHVQQSGPFAVANAYVHWYDLTREEVSALLEEKDTGEEGSA